MGSRIEAIGSGPTDVMPGIDAPETKEVFQTGRWMLKVLPLPRALSTVT